MGDLSTKIIDVCIWIAMAFLIYLLFTDFSTRGIDYIVAIIVSILLLERNKDPEEWFWKPFGKNYKKIKIGYGIFFIGLGILDYSTNEVRDYRDLIIYIFLGFSFIFEDILKKKKL